MRRFVPILGIALLLGLPLAAPPAAGDGHDEEAPIIAIRGGTVWTVSGERLEDATVIVEGGKITGVGGRLEIPARAEIVDATGQHVIPGLIDARSSLYLGGLETGDGTPVGPHLRIADGLDLFVSGAREVLEEGVTTVYVGPGNRGSIGGLGAAVRAGAVPDLGAAVLKPDAALKFSLGVGQAQKTSSEWRLGGYLALRDALLGARRYREAQEKYAKDLAEYEVKKKEFDKKKQEADKKEGVPDEEKKPPAAPEKKEQPPGKPRKPRHDPGSEVLLQAIDGKIPVHIEAERVDAIRNALKLGEEFGLKWTLVGGAEAGALAGDLVRAKVPVIIGPVVRSPLDGVDALIARSETAGVLERAGVPVAIASGARGGLASRHIRYEACLAVRHGMDRDAALRGLTIVPARILGIADRVGSIEEGRDADLVVLDGPPLESLSRVTHVVRGTEVVRVKLPERPVAATPAAGAGESDGNGTKDAPEGKKEEF